MKCVGGGTRALRRREHEIAGQVQGIAKQEETRCPNGRVQTRNVPKKEI